MSDIGDRFRQRAREAAQRFELGVRSAADAPRCDACGGELGRNYSVIDRKRLCRECARGVTAILWDARS